MNNFKFRAWDKKHKEMFEVVKIEFHPNIFYMAKEPAWIVIRAKNEIELMQSTGLKDKNGVEIFEGDIVAGKFYFAGVGYFDTGEREVIVRNKPVLWEDGKFLCSGFDLSEMNECIKVIGNIYKNKELLR